MCLAEAWHISINMLRLLHFQLGRIRIGASGLKWAAGRERGTCVWWCILS